MHANLLYTLTLLVVLGCGLVAGVFFAFSTFCSCTSMRTRARVSKSTATHSGSIFLPFWRKYAMLASRKVLVLTCFMTTVALAGCGSPAVSQPGTRQEATLPSAVPAPSSAPRATASATVPASTHLATTVPTTVPTATLLPSATALPTSAPTATDAPTPQATVRPILSESNTKLTISLPDGVTLLDFTISPDGQHVVYVAGSRSSYGSWEDAAISSVPLHGGVPVQLGALDWQARAELNYSAPYDQYVITPDSRAVIFQDADALYRAPITGGAPQQIGDGLGAAGDAGPMTGESMRSLNNQVPDFRLYDACNCLIYRTQTALSVLPLDGAPAMTITDTPGGDSYIYGYTVSADGRWLLYDVRKYDQWDEPKTPSWGAALIKIVAVYSVPLSGGAPILLASAPTDDGAIKDYAISRDGTELFYSTYDDDGEGVEQGQRHWRLPLTGGTPTLRNADS
jgi:hypothetical protein